MGLKAINPLLKTVAKKLPYIAPKAEVRSLESLGLKMEQLTGDVVQISKKKTVPSIFGTPKMAQARQMNRTAVKQIKAGEVVHTYPKATPQDLKRLTSETIEDSYSRVLWTNPRDGKIYNLLKQGETKDGKVIVRILDEEGAFIKEAEIMPKHIAIIDRFSIEPNAVPKEHGDVVRIFAQRHNPFAKYTLVNMAADDIFVRDFDGLCKAADEIKAKNFDFISISQGDETVSLLSLEKLKRENQDIIIALNEHTQKGTRILMASGNGGKESINSYISGQIEGVGSLSKEGKISEFSASRHIKYTQHYERGEFKERLVYNDKGEAIGLNITGERGCDYKFKYRIRSDKDIQKIKELEQKKRTIESQLNKVVKEIEKIRSCNEDMSSSTLSSKYHLWSKLRKELKDISIEIKNITSETMCYHSREDLYGTSLSTPIRTAKLALNDMMEGIL